MHSLKEERGIREAQPGAVGVAHSELYVSWVEQTERAVRCSERQRANKGSITKATAGHSSSSGEREASAATAGAATTAAAAELGTTITRLAQSIAAWSGHWQY